MPSRMVPMFSNSAETSHMIHWLMPWMRSTRPIEAAMAPTEIMAFVHRSIPVAATPTRSSELIVWSDTTNKVMSRACPKTGFRNRFIEARP